MINGNTTIMEASYRCSNLRNRTDSIAAWRATGAADSKTVEESLGRDSRATYYRALALIIAYTILGGSFYTYSIMGPKNPILILKVPLL